MYMAVSLSLLILAHVIKCFMEIRGYSRDIQRAQTQTSGETPVSLSLLVIFSMPTGPGVLLLHARLSFSYDPISIGQEALIVITTRLLSLEPQMQTSVPWKCIPILSYINSHGHVI